MKKPHRIKLFGYEIKISWSEPPAQANAVYQGRNYSWLHEIWCDGGCRGKGQNLLHELLHHISNSLEMGLEDKQIEPLSTALTEFIRLNPKTVQFIQKSK